MTRRVALLGATASGKTDAAHEAARRVGGCEIVCADAMTTYRGMDIGTAKPSDAQRSEVTYHLLDVLDPSEQMSLGRFCSLADEAIEGIERRGHAVVLVGGTGLYARGVVDRIEVPPSVPEIRARLEREALEDDGPERLFAQLSELDPVAAKRMDPRNARRTVRALEVVLGTGRAFSSFSAPMSQYPATDWTLIGIRFDARDADARIERRFDEMVRAGLCEEVAALAGRPGGLSRTARQAAGYREMLEAIEQGRSAESAIEEAKAATRRLARRQWRMLRRDPRIQWMPDADAAREALCAALGA